MPLLVETGQGTPSVAGPAEPATEQHSEVVDIARQAGKWWTSGEGQRFPSTTRFRLPSAALSC